MTNLKLVLGKEQLESRKTIDLIERLKIVLDDVKRRSIDWKPTRFGSYLRDLETRNESRVAISPTDPRTHAADLERREAIAQCIQLVGSAVVWPLLDQLALTSKLREIFAGPSIAPNDRRADDARNKLFELVIAARLYSRNIDVQITRTGADVEATLPGGKVIAVECKRPASLSSLADNVRSLRKQLKQRRDFAAYDGGLVVLALDRIFGWSGKPTYFRDRDELDTTIQVESARVVAAIRELSVRKELRIRAELGMVAYIGPAWARDDLSYYAVSITQRFPCTVDVADPRALEMNDAFAQAEKLPRRSDW